MRKKGTIKEREVSPERPLAPGAERSHQLQEFLNRRQVCYHQQDPDSHLGDLFLLDTSHQHLLSISGVSENMGMTWEVVSIFLDTRIHLNSLSHHNLSPPMTILSSTLRLFLTLHLC